MTRRHVACMTETRNAHKNLIAKPEGKSTHENLGVNRTILKWISRKQEEMAWTGLTWLTIRTGGGLLWHGNESSASMSGWKFGHMNDYAPRSYLKFLEWNNFPLITYRPICGTVCWVGLRESGFNLSSVFTAGTNHKRSELAGSNTKFKNKNRETTLLSKRRYALSVPALFNTQPICEKSRHN